MGISGARDLEDVRRGLTHWLAAWRPGSTPRVSAVGQPPTGLSAETLFVDVEWADGDVTSRQQLVARLPPHGDGLFPVCDLAIQGRFQGILAGAGVPAVAPLSVELDPAWIGCPFLVMPRVPGRAVRSDTPYLRHGWLAAQPPEVQRRLHREFVAALAAIHRLDPAMFEATPPETRTLDLGILDTGPGSAVAGTLGLHLQRWERYLAWAAAGEVPPPLERAIRWCRAHLPAEEPPASLLWGDVQLGNAVFEEDGSLAALLDFELAAVGPAEIDLGWFLVLHDMTVERCEGDLPGFPDRDATVAAYEEALGRRVADLRWYEVFAAMRSGAILVRVARLLARAGIDDGWLTTANPTRPVIDRLIGP